MRVSIFVPVLAVMVSLALAGCGGSAPDTSSSGTVGLEGWRSASAPASAKAPPAPATGTFAVIPAEQLQHVTRTTANCNLDAVDGKPAGSNPVERAADATFSGWAGDAENKTVPARLELVLTGNQDFALETPTGMPRPDVATVQKIAAFVTSGYSVKANLSAVPAGDYGVTLLYATPAGAELRCPTRVKLSIR